MRRDARRAVDVQTTQPTPVRVTSAARDSERWLGTAHPRALTVGWIAADHGDVEEQPVRAPGVEFGDPLLGKPRWMSYTASPSSYSAPAEPQERLRAAPRVGRGAHRLVVYAEELAASFGLDDIVPELRIAPPSMSIPLAVTNQKLRHPSRDSPTQVGSPGQRPWQNSPSVCSLRHGSGSPGRWHPTSPAIDSVSASRHS